MAIGKKLMVQCEEFVENALKKEGEFEEELMVSQVRRINKNLIST